MNWKHWAGIYLLVGAGVTVYAYTKTKVISPALVVTWPMNISAILKS